MKDESRILLILLSGCLFTACAPDAEQPSAPAPEEAAEGVADRQDRLAWYDTAALRSSTILQIGCGGLGGEIGASLVRQGAGKLVLCDHDIVTTSNLNRQRFYAHDRGQNKAIALGHNLCLESCLGTECVAHAIGFQPDSRVPHLCQIRFHGVNQCFVRDFAVTGDEYRDLELRQLLEARKPSAQTGIGVRKDRKESIGRKSPCEQ